MGDDARAAARTTRAQRSLTLPGRRLAGDGVEAAPRPAAASPDEPAFVEIAFERGVPIAINGVAMPPLELIGSLDIIAGAHGVGRVEQVEPSAMIALHEAHQRLQQAAIARRRRAILRRASPKSTCALVRNGSWFAPLRPALDAFVDAVQERVTGVVRLKLFKGECADRRLPAWRRIQPERHRTSGRCQHQLRLTTISDTSTTSRTTDD